MKNEPNTPNTQNSLKPNLWRIPETAITNERLNQLESSLFNRLQYIAGHYNRPRFASSLAVEDMVITDMIAKHQLAISIFTLDTHKLPLQTKQLLDTLSNYYVLDIECILPINESVITFEKDTGIDAIYQSIDARKACCYLRKVEPLNRALSTADAWITGQRREQSSTRTTLEFSEEDIQRNMQKYNPIADWTEQDVWAYIKAHNVPYNQLYNKGYPSIGCEPCTKAVRADEDIRAGRWWWESANKKECGLHVTQT